MKIGALSFTKPYILAPLAGYTDLPFRLLCREMGAGLCFSEMISSHGLVYGQKKTLAMLASVQEERPVGFQLFGNDPAIMGEAAARINDYPFDCIDINMGCPVKKVIKKGSGAALMKDPEKASLIIQNVCQNSSIPVTVKFRSGWNTDQINAVEFAQMAEASGACMVSVHARTWSQAFGGTADWKIIKMVKEKVAIPVIGNGDVLSYDDGQQMIQETGCDGVMIGRGALGNPWVFQPGGIPDTFSGRLPVLLRHIELCKRFLPTDKMLFRIKNHIQRYLTALPGAGKIRKQINLCKNVEELAESLQNTEDMERATKQE